MAYELPSLPYDYTALEPAISHSTLEFHHDKHHAGYVSKYNNAVEGTELDSKSLEEVIKAIALMPVKQDYLIMLPKHGIILFIGNV